LSFGVVFRKPKVTNLRPIRIMPVQKAHLLYVCWLRFGNFTNREGIGKTYSGENAGIKKLPETTG